MTARLRVEWPDPTVFARRGGRPLRILAVSDEIDDSLNSPATREGLAPIDMVIGCGDLPPDYLGFVADAFVAPLHYVHGNHDVGSDWEAALNGPGGHVPHVLRDGRLHDELGVPIVGFSGSPRYSDRGVEVSDAAMWWRVLRFAVRRRRGAPLLVVTHAAPRGVNDAADHAHRGFPAFRWLAERLQPPLWLHGHTTVVRHDVTSRLNTLGPTLLYNCHGSTLIELVAVATPRVGDSETPERAASA